MSNRLLGNLGQLSVVDIKLKSEVASLRKRIALLEEIEEQLADIKALREAYSAQRNMRH
jgi:hypothetical protein